MTNLTAVRSNSDLQSDELLGFLEFHTIGDLRIHKNELGDLFDHHGLDAKFLPREIKPHDAYRRATTEAQSSIMIDYNGGKQKARLLVREVKADNNLIIRHLVREIVDEKNELLDYNTVGKFLLKRKTNHMDISWDPNFLDEYPYDVLLTDTQALYVDWTEYHTRSTISNIVKRMMKAMNHISVMPNGKVTFVPKNQRLTLENVKSLIEDLAPYHRNGGESIIEIIPVIDTIDQRDMVQKRAESQMTAEANTLLADFAELLDKDNVGLAAVKRYAARTVDLKIRLEEYETLISRKMTVISNQLDDAMDRIKQTEKMVAE